MSADSRRKAGSGRNKRGWPKRALGLFFVIVLVIYSLVFFTGARKATPKLGIDLEGGTRVTLVPQSANPTNDQLNQARTILENRVNGMGVSGATVVVDGQTLVITVPGQDASEAQNIGQTSKLYFRPVADPAQPDIGSLSKVMGDMANRWVKYGVVSQSDAQDHVNKVVDALNQQKQGGDKGIQKPQVSGDKLPDTKNNLEAQQRRSELTKMLRDDRQSTDPTKQAAASVLLKCEDKNALDPLAGTDDPAKPLVACDPSQGQATLLDEVPLLNGVTDPNGPRLTGEQIDTGRPITGGMNSKTGQMEINFAFKQSGDSNGSATWAELTQKNMQRQIAITLDSQVISAPVIQSPTPIGQATSITGNFSQDEATNLANNLRYGALPLSFAGQNGEQGGTVETVPPSLGKASLRAGLIAGLVGLGLVAIFVLAYYRLFGFVSILTLIASGLLVFGSLVLLGRWVGYSLDLSGIAGLIIGIGTTADSFVVYYERIKDEVRNGRTFRSGALRGWERARNTIVTGNMVTLIGSAVVYFLSVGQVKGFAFTLGLTTIFDLVVTFLVTAPLVLLITRRPFWSKASVNGMGRVYKLADRNRARLEKAEEKIVETGRVPAAAEEK